MTTDTRTTTEGLAEWLRLHAADPYVSALSAVHYRQAARVVATHDRLVEALRSVRATLEQPAFYPDDLALIRSVVADTLDWLDAEEGR